MGYKTVLVHVDRSPRASTRIEIGRRIARQFDGHLIGLHACSVTPMPGYMLAVGGGSIAEESRRAALEEAAAAERRFADIAGRDGEVSVEWRSSLEDAAAVVPLHARYADLLILGQPSPPGTPGVDREFAGRVLLTCGRPVMFVPFAGEYPVVGQRVLVSWNAAREAMNAATTALPLLKHAARVDVVMFNPKAPAHGAVPGADVAAWLARHGVRVQISEERVADADIGGHLLSLASDLSSDLLVMGAYGHSRLAEFVLGGVTRTVLESMTLPVLMAH
ncbi:MAG: universal stress protein [Burkholderiales bacterium]|jgi:nucleotide-binding universal stress UspA family protein|nr:universal stress protein [Burkholderiales bacterium]